MSVRAQERETYIQCKDLDQVISRRELCPASKEQFKFEKLDEKSIARLKKPYSYIQTVTRRLPVEVAQELLAAAGKIRIAWVVYLLRDVGRKTTLPRHAIATPNTYCAKKRRDGVAAYCRK